MYQTVAIHNHFLFFFSANGKNINAQQSLELVIIHKDRQRDGEQFDNWKVLNINVIIGKGCDPLEDVNHREVCLAEG